MRAINRRAFLRRAAAVAASATLSNPSVRAAPEAGTVTLAIDVHAHLPLAKFGSPLAARFANPEPADPFAVRMAEAVASDSFEAIGSLRIEEMDRWGVSRTVLMPIDFGSADKIDSHWQEAVAVAELARLHPDRFIPFFACNPMRGAQGVRRLERAVRELGARGVKIHPLAGFAPDDREVCYPLFEKCIELGVPVLGHCRPVGRGSADQMSRPERYAKAAKDLPDLKICLGHFGGGPWAEEALRVVAEHPNAYGDLSTHQNTYAEDPAGFFDLLRRVMDGPARKRVMYGTDWPTVRARDAEFIAALRRGGPVNSPPILNAEEIELLLAGNARTFLGL